MHSYPSHRRHLILLQRILVALQYALLDEFLRLRPALQPLLQTIRAHMQVELALLLLQGRRGGRVGEDVPLNEVIAGRALVEALLEVVGCALAL